MGLCPYLFSSGEGRVAAVARGWRRKRGTDGLIGDTEAVCFVVRLEPQTWSFRGHKTGLPFV